MRRRPRLAKSYLSSWYSTQFHPDPTPTKHQITIPVAELRAAGLEAGERLVARADGPGRVILEREDDILGEFVGALTGVYADRELESLRDEWD